MVWLNTASLYLYYCVACTCAVDGLSRCRLTKEPSQVNENVTAHIRSHADEQYM